MEAGEHVVDTYTLIPFQFDLETIFYCMDEVEEV